MFLGDFHVHSTFSDGKLTIPQIVDMYGRAGFGAVAVTDHLCEETVIGKAAAYLGKCLTPASFPFYREILRSEAERAWDQYRLVLIPGLELTKNSISNHRSAHVLALGVDDWITAEGDIVEVVRRVKSHGALAVAAHPVWTRKVEKQTYEIWDRREELAQEFDAWEVASGPYLFDEVGRTCYPKLASSDLHRPEQMTSWKTVLHCERSVSAILDAVRHQEIDFRFYADSPVHDSLDLRPGRHDWRDLVRPAQIA